MISPDRKMSVSFKKRLVLHRVEPHVPAQERNYRIQEDDTLPLYASDIMKLYGR